jgi:predicted transcriptional regulator
MPRYKQQGIETATVGVVLPKEIKLRLDRVAESKGWSVSQTAASAIEEWLDLVETPSPANQKQGAA